MIYIIILNWNGYNDTIDCLESIRQNSYNNYKLVIVDNDSSDNSIEILKSYISEKKINAYLIENNDNSGFSKGCNIGIDYAICQADCDYIWLLNNDTIVDTCAIEKLVNFFEKNNDIDVITPQINYYDNKTLIWNCGGRISLLGFRKYFFPKKEEKILPKKEYLKVSFITNCASFFRKDFFSGGYRLDERFFFGEEDFSLCLYAKKKKMKMACLLTSKIYHKVSSSIQKQSYVDDNKIFVYYINRLVDMKLFYRNKLLFWCYKRIYFPYIKHTIKNKISNVTDFLRLLDFASSEYNSVDKNLFERIMKYGYKSYKKNSILE